MPSNAFRVTDQELRMSEAQTIAAKDHPLVQLSEDLKLGPFEKGHEYRMARWIAEKLKIEGIIEIKDPQPITNVELRTILFHEVRGSLLTKLPEKFYPRMRNYLRLLREQASKSGKPAVMREEEQAVQNIRDLLNSRLQKILRLTQATSPPVTALEGLSYEERELYQQVREITDSWIEELQDF